MKFESDVPEYHIQVEPAYDEDNMTVGEAFALKESGDDPRGFAVKFIETEDYVTETGRQVFKSLYNTDTDIRLKDLARKAEIEKKLLDSCSRDPQCRLYVPRKNTIIGIVELAELKRKAAAFDAGTRPTKDSEQKFIPDTSGGNKKESVAQAR
jgi:hypothetical protein